MIWLSQELQSLRAKPYTSMICFNNISLLLVINNSSPAALTVNSTESYDDTLS